MHARKRRRKRKWRWYCSPRDWWEMSKTGRACLCYARHKNANVEPPGNVFQIMCAVHTRLCPEPRHLCTSSGTVYSCRCCKAARTLHADIREITPETESCIHTISVEERFAWLLASDCPINANPEPPPHRHTHAHPPIKSNCTTRNSVPINGRKTETNLLKTCTLSPDLNGRLRSVLNRWL